MLQYFRLVGLALLLSVGFGTVGQAASFDCNKATTETEIVICSDPELSALDDRMHNIFRSAFKFSNASSSLRELQRTWISDRDMCLADIPCLKRSYSSQISKTWFENCWRKDGSTFELLNNAYNTYGTAYSGGDHSQRLGSAAATLDLYRGLIGLSSADFSGQSGYFDLYDRDARQELLSAILENRIVYNTTYLSDAEKFDLGILYDIGLTVERGQLDWWLNTDFHGTEHSKEISGLAKKFESLDWVLSVMSASHMPWVLDWHLAYEAKDSFESSRKNLLKHALSKYEKNSHLKWLVVAAMFMQSDDLETVIIEDAFDELVSEANECRHSNENYLAMNMLGLEISRMRGLDFYLKYENYFVDSLKGHAVEKLFKWELATAFKGTASKTGVDKTKLNLKRLSDVTTNAYYLRKIIVGLAYLSSTPDELIANVNHITDRHPGKKKQSSNSSLSLLIDAKLMRLFNVLNVESLSNIVSQLKLGASDEKALVNALINRLFVQKEYDRAMSLLPSLLSKLDAAKQRDVLQIMEIGLPAPTSLAIAILSIQEKTVWITNSNYIPDISIQTELDWKSGTDLNESFLDASFLERDLNVLLMHPSGWFASHSMCCLNIIQRLKRHSDREASANIKFEENIKYSFSGNENTIQNLIAYDELKKYGPETGLARSLSEVILNWEKNVGTRWYSRSDYHDEIAKNLALIVRLQKRNAIGYLGGKHIGQIAYEKLKKNYGDTQASADTKYWYYCDNNCR